MKHIRLLLLCCVCMTSFVVASPLLSVQYESVQPLEPYLGTISTDGTFLTGPGTLRIYEGRREVYFDHDMVFSNGTYYFYVVFPREGNFTLDFGSVVYSQFGEVSSQDLSTTVFVSSDSSGNLLTIDPPFIYSLSSSSTLVLRNKGLTDLNVNVDDIDVTIASGGAYSLPLTLATSLDFLTVSSYLDYSIPLIYLGTVNETSNNSTEGNSPTLSVDLENSTFFLVTNTSFSFPLRLLNTGSTPISNITLISSPRFVNLTFPTSISAETYEVSTVNIFSEFAAFVNDTIVFSYDFPGGNSTIHIPLTLYISENVTTLPDSRACVSLGGSLCDGTCDGDSTFASDGYCCMGTCTPFGDVTPDSPTSSSGYAWLIGILIFIVLGLIGWVLYKRYRHVTPLSSDEHLQKSTQSYQNKLTGGRNSEQVSGKLERH